ncbi:MAG: HNH endonuclease signature motif containing protein [Syntrophales bacterium]|nr:HNH endonuclease signature motif containing protein [Syntrophales bacterium]
MGERPLLPKFERKFKKGSPDECWLWTGSQMRQGLAYGRIAVKGKIKAAHRVSYELYVGPIPDGLFVLHKCDVPYCVNPNHLFLGTQADNNRDMHKKGRYGIANNQGERHGMSKFKNDDIAFIRSGILPTKDLAKKFHVCPDTIYRIIKRKTWRHIE